MSKQERSVGSKELSISNSSTQDMKRPSPTPNEFRSAHPLELYQSELYKGRQRIQSDPNSCEPLIANIRPSARIVSLKITYVGAGDGGASRPNEKSLKSPLTVGPRKESKRRQALSQNFSVTRSAVSKTRPPSSPLLSPSPPHPHVLKFQTPDPHFSRHSTADQHVLSPSYLDSDLLPARLPKELGAGSLASTHRVSLPNTSELPGNSHLRFQSTERPSHSSHEGGNWRSCQMLDSAGKGSNEGKSGDHVHSPRVPELNRASKQYAELIPPLFSQYVPTSPLADVFWVDLPEESRKENIKTNLRDTFEIDFRIPDCEISLNGNKSEEFPEDQKDHKMYHYKYNQKSKNSSPLSGSQRGIDMLQRDEEGTIPHEMEGESFASLRPEIIAPIEGKLILSVESHSGHVFSDQEDGVTTPSFKRFSCLLRESPSAKFEDLAEKDGEPVMGEVCVKLSEIISTCSTGEEAGFWKELEAEKRMRIISIKDQLIAQKKVMVGFDDAAKNDSDGYEIAQKTIDGKRDEEITVAKENVKVDNFSEIHQTPLRRRERIRLDMQDRLAKRNSALNREKLSTSTPS